MYSQEDLDKYFADFKAFVKENFIPCAHVAKKIGISHSYLRHLMIGYYPITIQVVKKISEVWEKKFDFKEEEG